MIMRALNTAGQDDGEKLIAYQKEIEELNVTVEDLSIELAGKTNRIEELCRLANDSRDAMEHIKSQVIINYYYYNYFSSQPFLLIM